MIELSHLQRDALTEMFNIGMGRAAAAMNRLVDEEITLRVPEIGMMDRNGAAALLEAVAAPRICSVRQYVRGPFSAEALLIFPQSKSLEIVRAMIGDDVPLDEMTDMEREALCEIGNIILNACIGTMSNILHEDFSISLPEFAVGTCAEILGSGDTWHDDQVMLLYIDFRLEKHQISGHVVILQDLPAVQAFLAAVQREIDAVRSALDDG